MKALALALEEWFCTCVRPVPDDAFERRTHTAHRAQIIMSVVCWWSYSPVDEDDPPHAAKTAAALRTKRM